MNPDNRSSLVVLYLLSRESNATKALQIHSVKKKKNSRPFIIFRYQRTHRKLFFASERFMFALVQDSLVSSAGLTGPALFHHFFETYTATHCTSPRISEREAGIKLATSVTVSPRIVPHCLVTGISTIKPDAIIVIKHVLYFSHIIANNKVGEEQ